MKRLAAVCLFLAGCATSQLSDSARLKQIGDDYWQHQLDENIGLQIKFGLPTKHLPDVSYAHAQREAELARSLLQRLNAIHPDGLTEDERLSLGILRWQNQLVVDGLPWFWYRIPVTPYTFQFLGISQPSSSASLNFSGRSSATPIEAACSPKCPASPIS